MADTTISASTPAEVPQAQLWQKELCRQALAESFWGKFMGKGPNNFIQVNEDFKKEKGDAINFGLMVDLSRVIHADGWVEGNEEQMTTYYDSVILDRIADGVRIDGKLTEQRASYDMRFQAKEGLRRWTGRVIDEIIFKKLSGVTFQAYPGTANGTLGSLETAMTAAVANTNILYGGDALATTQIEESDVFSLDLVIDALACAKQGVIGSTTIYRMRPPFMLAISPYQRKDLLKSAEYKQMMRDAEVRGKENPLFSGADAYYQGVWIYEHDLIQTSSTWGADGNVAGATALFLGQQAGLWGDAQDGWDWIEDKFNYGNKWGVATSKICGFDKASFNSIDFSVIAIKTAAKNPRL